MALVARPNMSAIWASGGARVQPSDAKVNTGWTAEIPPHQWENWVQNRQDEGIIYLFQRGMAEWSATEDYAGGGLSYTIGSDGNMYRSVQASGPSSTVVNPVTNTSFSHWVPFTKGAGVGVPGLVELASFTDVSAGTSNTKAVTPAGLLELFSGMLAYFPTNIPPAGWMVADGSAVSRTVYATLFNRIGTRWGQGNGATTFNLPDLRGEFIRGWDNNRGIDTGRSFGTVQSSQNLTHSHTGTANTSGGHQHTTDVNPYAASESAGNGWVTTGGDKTFDTVPLIPSSWNGDHTHSLTINASGGSESRPRNIAMLGCIKY